MKNRLFIFSVTGIAGGLVFCPFEAGKAIEPPPDTATPPAGLLQNASRNVEQPLRELTERPTEKVPFLGLSTAVLPEMVADHVGLEKGSGVIVRTVVPGSPAEKSGLSTNDIIIKVGDTAVGNPEALSSTIRSLKIGDKIPIELIHKGKQSKVEVILNERPTDLISGPQQNPMLDTLPKAHADRLRGLIEQNLGGLGNGGIVPDQQFENTFRMMRERMNRALGEGIQPMDQGANGGTSFQHSSTIRVMDNDGSVEIVSSDGKTEVTVRDTSNSAVWSGPWNTEQDKAAAPADIRERIDKVNSGNQGFSLRFGKRGKAQPDTIDN